MEKVSFQSKEVLNMQTNCCLPLLLPVMLFPLFSLQYRVAHYKLEVVGLNPMEGAGFVLFLSWVRVLCTNLSIA